MVVETSLIEKKTASLVARMNLYSLHLAFAAVAEYHHERKLPDRREVIVGRIRKSAVEVMLVLHVPIRMRLAPNEWKEPDAWRAVVADHCVKVLLVRKADRERERRNRGEDGCCHTKASLRGNQFFSGCIGDMLGSVLHIP